MTSLVTENPIINAPNALALGPDPDTVNVRAGIFETLTVTSEINGVTIDGDFVTTDDAQNLANKTLLDTTTFVANTADTTKRVRFSLASATAGTTSILNIAATASRTFTINDPGANANIVVSEGNQTVNAAITFTSPLTIDGLIVSQHSIVLSGLTIQSLTASGVAADISFAIIPKNQGALLVAVPDDTATGGNSRGIYSTDFQRSRAAATQVSSGNYSTISGGRNNTASGEDSTVGGGTSNTAAGVASFVVGHSSAASQDYSVAIGRLSTSSHAGACTINDGSGVALASTAANQFSCSFSGGYRLMGAATSFNDLWNIYPIITTATSNATPTNIFTIVPATNTVYYFTAFVAASNSAGSTVMAHRSSAVFRNIAGTLTMAAQFDTWDSGDAGLAGTTLTWSTSGTQARLQATGLAATTIHWRGAVQYTSDAI